MCGIVGYVGCKEAQPILVNCLKRLEYRGYDSCGLAFLGDGLQVYKDVVRIGELEKILPPNGGRVGIGHTRWATHGRPSKVNAHPHVDCRGEIAVVHNGIISNFLALRERLVSEGHHFFSETDTEVLPHLIEKYYRGNLEEAVRRALQDVEGSYAVAVIHRNSGELIAARHESPLLIGLGDGEKFLASDAPALVDYSDRVVYLEDGDLVVMHGEGLKISNQGREVVRKEHHLEWTAKNVGKAGYEHFMLKEIHEQPGVIEEMVGESVSTIEPSVNLEVFIDRTVDGILLLACGTSYYAAMVGQQVLEEIARLPVRVELASEFSYSRTVVGRTLAIAISQSGETADTNRALKKARDLGCRTMAITNVRDSTVTRIAEQSFYTKAGPEIGVAATKSFTAQLIAFYLIALSLAEVDAGTFRHMTQELRLLPSKVQRVLDSEKVIAGHGRRLSGYESVFYVGRGISYPMALEGALKIKEIAYIHAEGYAAGELKHGPFALLREKFPVVALTLRDDTYEAMLSNIKEIKARESPVLALAEEGDQEIAKYVDYVLPLPQTDRLFAPVVISVALQLLAYFAARSRGCPIDTPRNLAKSVTVE
ncbi:MAG: glucosamine--fructose-6-phosphate aminotransferase {isomerizing [Dehalococcoidia bacterium]|nr:glucosamine--fructose-6-phosphate aminotransferase {isomerizing [Dehalococcoidia bacterium]